MRQKKTETNEDFVKTMLRAIKAYKRHGGPFLWTPANAMELKQEMDDAKAAFVSALATGAAMAQEQEDDVCRVKWKSCQRNDTQFSSGCLNALAVFVTSCFSTSSAM
ncbi:MAG: hypothetical protein SGBAC_011227, partial [Bacillariaceae sp.]